MGFYYSLYEWYNPLWLTDKPRYVREHMFPQFKDLVTRYKPAIIFSDGEWELPSSEWHSPELLAWLFNDSPVKDEVVINDRWGKDTRHKHGGYWTTEYTPGMSGMDHPWEESRGMGFSYGYNRAETLEDYHTGRELVIMLVDLVSRGGNLLLDIGPAADGTIPVIMEERLIQIGDWLKVNGEAIYGTQPWKAAPKPKIEYNKEFDTGIRCRQARQRRSVLYRQRPGRLRDSSALAGTQLPDSQRGRSQIGDPARIRRAAKIQSRSVRRFNRLARSPASIASPACLGTQSVTLACNRLLESRFHQ